MNQSITPIPSHVAAIQPPVGKSLPAFEPTVDNNTTVKPD